MSSDEYLKHFADGETILATETNDNNDFLLNKITTSINAFRQEVEQLIAGSVLPAGVIICLPVSTIPTGWLKCDGSSLLRTDYADLFTAIGTTYGYTDSTHFNLPDFQGAFLRGFGGASSTIGTKQLSAAPNITGYFRLNGTTGPAVSGAFTRTSDSTSSTGWDTDSARYRINFNASNSSSVYQDGITEIRPDNYAVNWIIKY